MRLSAFELMPQVRLFYQNLIIPWQLTYGTCME